MIVEPLDDLGLIAALLEKSNLSTLFNTHYPDHGNWSGTSGGKTLSGWLLYILSECDHRLSHVEDWAALRLNTLSTFLDEDVCRALDFSDDRLSSLLDRLSDDEQWKQFEIALGKSFLEVFALQQQL